VVRSVNATWNFGVGASCTAAISSPLLSLDISVADSKATFTAQVSRGSPTPRGAAIPITYSGDSGSWTIIGRGAGLRQIAAIEPITDEEASRILFLLNGGTIRIGKATERVPVMRVPNAGQVGRAWFECVRKNLFQ
jgi:hypothetical protein